MKCQLLASTALESAVKRVEQEFVTCNEQLCIHSSRECGAHNGRRPGGPLTHIGDFVGGRLPYHRHRRHYLYQKRHHHLQPVEKYILLSYVCNYNILCELCPFHWRTETIIADNLLTKRCKTCPIKLRGGTIMKRVNRLKKGLRALEQVELSTLCGPGSREMMTSRAFSPSPP